MFFFFFIISSRLGFVHRSTRFVASCLFTLILSGEKESKSHAGSRERLVCPNLVCKQAWQGLQDLGDQAELPSSSR